MRPLYKTIPEVLTLAKERGVNRSVIIDELVVNQPTWHREFLVRGTDRWAVHEKANAVKPTQGKIVHPMYIIHKENDRYSARSAVKSTTIDNDPTLSHKEMGDKVALALCEKEGWPIDNIFNEGDAYLVVTDEWQHVCSKCDERSYEGMRCDKCSDQMCPKHADWMTSSKEELCTECSNAKKA